MTRVAEIRVSPACLAALLALAVALFSQSPAILNPYLVNDDAAQHIYWMRQFRDPSLFRGDLLTENARHWLPWGFVFIYYAGSLLIDPLLLSKLAPLVLLPLSAVFLYGLLKTISGSRYAGILGVAIFALTGSFFPSMIGGHPRAFGFPLLIIFLYYLVRGRYLAGAAALAAQSLFYPPVFFLSVLTCPGAFIRRRGWGITFDRSPRQAVIIGAGVLAGFCILAGKYAVPDNPRLGPIINRNKASSWPETGARGRLRIMPISPLFYQAEYNLKESVFGDGTIEFLRARTVLAGIFRRYDELVSPRRPGWTFTPGIALVLFIILAAAGLLGKVRFPPEIFYLLGAGVVMYWVSSLLLFRLYRPERYMEYSFRTSGLILFSVIAGRLINRVRRPRLRTFCQAAPVFLALLFFPASRGICLTDFSCHQELYEYIRGLPAGTLVAAHPCLADGIPLFCRKRVFISFELSNPWYCRYWETVRERTYDFFDAYYSESPGIVGEFCRRNGIDCLVVDDRHFDPEYLAGGEAYFEPFGVYIARLGGERKKFILPRMPEESKLFSRRGISVIAAETFGERSELDRGSEEGPPDA